MSSLTVNEKRITTMSEYAIERAYALEAVAKLAPQVKMKTHHVLHAGLYLRTILIPAGVMITGALIKIATTLIVSGEVLMYVDDGTVALTGYNVLPASAGRKQAFVALSDTYLTMVFATQAKSIEQAENEFTNESQLLMSRNDSSGDTIVITGE